MNTLKLGGVTLNAQMVWEDRFRSQKVAQSVIITLGGTPVTYSQSLVAGESITLVSQRDRGWLTGAMVEQIGELAAVAGGVFELEINGVVRQVVFRHHEPPAFSAEPFVPRFNQKLTDYFTATIKLMTV